MILVNDGSTDASPQICDRFAGQDERIRVIHKKNNGVSSARNTGISMAKGDYIVFCDSDDFVDPIYLETLYCPDVDLSICGCYYTDQEGNIDRIARSEQNIIETVSPENMMRWFAHGSLYSVWTGIFKRSLVVEHKIEFDEKTSRGEDTIFMFEYVSHCKMVRFCDSILYFYVRYGKGTLSTTYSLKNIASLDYLNCYLDRWFKNHELYSELFYGKYFWTRNEMKIQFWNMFVDESIPLRQKLSYYQSMWAMETWRKNRIYLVEDDRLWMRLMVSQPFPMVVVICDCLRRIIRKGKSAV